MNFLTRRQETRAGATGSKLPAAPCVPRVRVRSGVGPITFLPGSLGGALGHWLSALWPKLSGGRGGREGKGRERKAKAEQRRGEERRGEEKLT